METQELIDRRDELKRHATNIGLEREISAWLQAIGQDTELCVYREGTIRPDDPILTNADIAAQTGWGEVGYVSLPSDRARGAYYPFYRAEQELWHTHAMGRKIAVADAMGKSIVRNVTNYTVGEGFNYQLSLKNRDDTAHVDELQRAQAALDKFVTVNKIPGNKERALIEETMPAGEALVFLKHAPDGIPRVRIRATDNLREPPDAHKVEDYYSLPGGLDWSFGVATPMGDSEDVVGYFVWWYGVGDNWEFIPESRAVLVKLNVPTDVKRGLSEFYATYREIQQVATGIYTAARGAELQAAIAGIEKVPPGLPVAAVENMTATPGSFVAQVNGGRSTRQVRVTPRVSGTLITSDHDFLYGPMGTPQGPLLIQVFAAVARRVAATYSMPEWMVSADASNNNQASSITAGSAFDVAMQGNQAMWCGVWGEICWKALALMGFDVQFLQAAMDLTVAGSQVASREEETDERIRVMRKEAGILSDRTYSTEVGLDYDAEQANIAKQPIRLAPIPAAGKVAGQPVVDPAQAAQPLGEQASYQQLVFSTLDRLASRAIPVEANLAKSKRELIQEAADHAVASLPAAPVPVEFDLQVERDADGLISKLVRVPKE